MVSINNNLIKYCIYSFISLNLIFKISKKFIFDHQLKFTNRSCAFPLPFHNYKLTDIH